MVFIHRGGFFSGNGYHLYGPDYLLVHDVLLVTFNYRLSVLGFLSLGNKVLSGNYGLKDQLLAMKWVKRNIAQFGGDPENMTLFGQSAGSASTEFHILSKRSKGLFHKAILQSGSVFCPWALTKTPKENAVLLANTLGQNLTDEKQLQDFFMAQPASVLIQASVDLQNKEQEEQRSSLIIRFVPCIELEGSEEAFITEPPSNIIKKGIINKVPMIIGTVNAEGAALLVGTIRYTENDLKMFNNATSWAVPINWNIKSMAEKDWIGKMVKRHLFSGKEISWSEFNDVVGFFNDAYFIMDIEKSIQGFLNYHCTPIYHYEMTFEPLRSLAKTVLYFKQGRNVTFKGAAHSDDNGLLFSNYIKDDIPFIKQDQIVSHRMTTMWTTFAKTGNPNYKGMNTKWKTIKKEKRSYLEIGFNLRHRCERVQDQRLNIWKDICKKSSTKYKCDL